MAEGKIVIFFDIGDTLGGVSHQLVPSGEADATVLYTFHPFKRALATLEALSTRSDVVLGLISNTPDPPVGVTAQDDNREFMGAMWQYFPVEELRIFSSEIGLEKPDLDIFYLALGRAQAHGSRVYFVGETPAERVAARATGMRAVSDVSFVLPALEHPGEEERTYMLTRTADPAGALARSTVLKCTDKEVIVRGFHSELLAAKGWTIQDESAADCAWEDEADLKEPAGYDAGDAGHGVGDDEARIGGTSHLQQRPARQPAALPSGILDQALTDPDARRATASFSTSIPLAGAHVAAIVRYITPNAVHRIVSHYSGTGQVRDNGLGWSRHILSPTMPQLERALADEMVALGLDVTFQPFTVARHQMRGVPSQYRPNYVRLRNVIGELKGVSDDVIIICAHLDSTVQRADFNPLTDRAPGADDNASGVAAVLLAAKAVVAACRGNRPGLTVRFCLWNAEEIGLLGSSHYVRSLGDDVPSIQAVLNTDTLGYSGPPPHHFEVHYGANSLFPGVEQRSKQLAELLRDTHEDLSAREVLSLRLDAVQLYGSPDPAAGRSDHGSFHEVGVAAVAVSEDFFPSPNGTPGTSNPHYHRSEDVSIDPVFTTSIARVLTATLMRLAAVVASSADVVDEWKLSTLLGRECGTAAHFVVDVARVKELFQTTLEAEELIHKSSADLHQTLRAFIIGPERYTNVDLLSRSGIHDIVHDIHRICGHPPVTDAEHVGSRFAASPVYDSAHFRIQYVTGASSDAVPGDTSELVIYEPGAENPAVIARVAASHTPAYVRLVAYWLERAHDMYVTAFGLKDPSASAGGRVPVRIYNTPFGAARPLPWGFEINNALVPDIVCAVSVHEYFHMVQFEYNLAWTGTWTQAIMEGGATYAEDGPSDKLNRYLDESTKNFNAGVGVINSPNQSLFDIAYKSCLFWRYLAEQGSTDERHVRSVSAYHHVIASAARGNGSTSSVIKGILQAPWNGERLPFAKPRVFRATVGGREVQINHTHESVMANYALACVLKNAAVDDQRFQFSENNETIGIANAMAQMGIVYGPKRTFSADSVPFSTVGVQHVLVPLGSAFHQVNVNGKQALQVTFTSSKGTVAPAVQLAILESNDGTVNDARVVDIVRHWAHDLNVTVPVDSAHLVVIAVTSADAQFDTEYSLSLDSEDAVVSHVFVTNWNSHRGLHYHKPISEWEGLSPDVQRPTPSKLHVKVHREGEATGAATLDVFYTTDRTVSNGTTWLRATAALTSIDTDDEFATVALIDAAQNHSVILLFVVDHDGNTTTALSRLPSVEVDVPANGGRYAAVAREAGVQNDLYHRSAPSQSSTGTLHSLRAAPSGGSAPPTIRDEFTKVAAWFLGPRGENREQIRAAFNELLDEHCDWREHYFPQDPPYITREVTESAAYITANETMRKNASDLVARLRNSAPFFSCRYQGHMNWDISSNGLLGYFATMLFNPNNVATEGSPVTTQLEVQVGEELCEMLGYGTARAPKQGPDGVRRVGWAHITSCGSVANIEGLWAARNVRLLARAVRDAVNASERIGPAGDIEVGLANGDKKKLRDLSDWEALNIPADHSLALYGALSDMFPDIDVTKVVGPFDAQHRGIREDERLQVFVPATRHYSWDKALALLGIGQSHLGVVTVDAHGRQDLSALKSKLLKCVEQNIAVIAVVVVVGTTAEGSVDNVEQVLCLREVMRREHGLDFYIHADAAWGGYFASMLHNPPPSTSVDGAATEFDASLVPSLTLSPYVRKQLAAMAHVDSITLDPHKAGWIQYPAGALAYANSALRHLLAFSAPILFTGKSDPSVGLFGIEGSKPGAAVSAVYLHHRNVGLHRRGHGLLCGMANWTSKRIFALLASMANDDILNVQTLQPLTEEERDKLTQLATMSNEQITEHPDLVALLQRVGSDLCINAFVVNYSYPVLQMEGVLKPVRNTSWAKANQLIEYVSQDLNISRAIGDEDPWLKGNVGRKRLWLIREKLNRSDYSGLDVMLKRLGVNDDEDGDEKPSHINMLVNTSMDPWPTAVGFLQVFQHELRQSVMRSIGRIEEPLHKHGFVMTESGEESCAFGNHLPVFSQPQHHYHMVARFQFSSGDDMRRFFKESASAGPFVLANSVDTRLYDVLHHNGPVDAFAFNGFPNPPHNIMSTDFTFRCVEILMFDHFDPRDTYPDEPEFFMYGRNGHTYISHCMTQFKDYHSVHELERVPGHVSPILLRQGFKLRIPELHGANFVSTDPFATEKEWNFTFTGEKGLQLNSTLCVKVTRWFDVKELNLQKHHH